MDWYGFNVIRLFFTIINKIDNGKTYQLLNLIAALLMAIGLFPKNAWFSFTLQVIWAIVAIIALIKLKKN